MDRARCLRRRPGPDRSSGGRYASGASGLEQHHDEAILFHGGPRAHIGRHSKSELQATCSRMRGLLSLRKRCVCVLDLFISMLIR